MVETVAALGARFEELVPLTTDGGFRLLAGREVGGGEPRVVIVGAGDDGARAWEAAQLDAIAGAHARIACRYVPRLAARGCAGGVAYVALACDATTTLEAVLRWAGATRQPPTPYGTAMGLPLILGEAFAAAHRAIDPETGAPTCIGSFGPSNVLLSAHGQPWIVGFGHDAAASLGPGTRAVRTGSHLAPEVGMGTPPTPASDVYVLDLFFRSLLPFVDLLPLAKQAIAGNAAGFPAEATRAWGEHQRRLTASQPAERYASIDEVMTIYRGWWDFLGVVADADAYIQHMGALERLRSDTTTLTVARDGSWFRAPGAQRVDIAGRKALRRVLRELAAARLGGPGRARAVDELVGAGWPGEKLVEGSGSSRLYVAIATLRQLGLGELIRKDPRGYLIDPDVPIALA